MNETNKIAWKRLSIEAAAIIGSILLAFAIDAWWEDRQERISEQEVLVDLQAEYQNHRDVITSQKTQHLFILRHVTRLRNAGQKGGWNSEEYSLDEAIFNLLIPTTADLGNGVRDSLIAAGNIEIIRDEQLRYELSEWDSVLAELLDDQILNRKIVLETIVPYFTRWGVPVRGEIETPEGDIYPSNPRSLVSNTDASTRLLSDPEFQSILDVRHMYMSHTVGEFVSVIAAVDSILSKIEMSLAN